MCRAFAWASLAQPPLAAVSRLVLQARTTAGNTCNCTAPYYHAGGGFFCAPSMGAHLRVQVPLRAGHSEQSEAQLRKGDRAWEGRRPARRVLAPPWQGAVPPNPPWREIPPPPAPSRRLPHPICRPTKEEGAKQLAAFCAAWCPWFCLASAFRSSRRSQPGWQSAGPSRWGHRAV